MKYHHASLINSLVVIALGLWGYFDSNSITAFIPVVAGILLLVLYPSFRRKKSLAINLTLALTFLLIIGLLKPMMGAVERNDSPSAMRVGVMILTSIIALVFNIAIYRGRKIEL